MTHKQQTWKIQFEIVTTRVARQPLLSANTCGKLGLISIHNTEQQKTLILQTVIQERKTDHETVNFNKKEEMDNLLKDYSDIFEALGGLPGKLHIEIDKTIEPVQHTPRKKEELRQKILSMEKSNIPKNVDTPTDWISSMVAVKKPGKLCICICLKDLNKTLKRNHYPLQTIQEILPGLAKPKYSQYWIPKVDSTKLN